MPDEKPPLICPILSVASTIGAALMTPKEAPSVLQVGGRNIAQVQVPIHAFGCMGDKCAMWHDAAKQCGIASGPQVMNLIGGVVNTAILRYFGETPQEEKDGKQA